MIRLPDYEAAGPSRENATFNFDIEDEFVSDSSPLLPDVLPPYDPLSIKEPVILDSASKRTRTARSAVSTLFREVFPDSAKSSYGAKWIFQSRVDLQGHEVQRS